MPKIDLLASGSDDKTIKLWDLNTGMLYHTFSLSNSGHNGVVHVLTSLGNGSLLASGSFDKTVKVWDLESLTLKYSFNHTNTPEAIVSLDDNALQMACSDKSGALKVYDLTNGQTILDFKDHTGSASSLTFSKRLNLLASGSSDKKINIYDMTLGTLKDTLDDSRGGHTGWVRSLVFLENDANNFLASGSDDSSVKIWDANLGTLKYTFDASTNGHSSAVWALASLGKHYLASGSNDNQIKIWALNDGSLKYTFKHSNQVRKLVTFNNSILISASYDSTIKVWSVY